MVPRITLWQIAVFIVSFVIVSLIPVLFGKWIKRVIRWRDTVKLIALGAAMALLGWIFARLHLHVFDPMFLRGGSLDAFKKA